MVIKKKTKMENGIRQGCPLSALLFILATEILSLEIKSCKTITGIKIGQQDLTTSQYADDTTLTLGDQKSITEALNIIHEFNYYSGLKPNKQKCIGIWLGPYKNSVCEYDRILFSCKSVKCLGIYLSNNQNECISRSWSEHIQRFKAALLP